MRSPWSYLVRVRVGLEKFGSGFGFGFGFGFAFALSLALTKMSPHASVASYLSSVTSIHVTSREILARSGPTRSKMSTWLGLGIGLGSGSGSGLGLGLGLGLGQEVEEADHVVDAKELREEVEHVAKELPRVGAGVRVARLPTRTAQLPHESRPVHDLLRVRARARARVRAGARIG